MIIPQAAEVIAYRLDVSRFHDFEDLSIEN